MLYYTLMPTRLVALGQPASEPAGQLPAFTTPRSIAVGETVDLWNEPDEIECVLDGRLAHQLLDIHPRTSTLQQTRTEARDRGWSSSRAGGRTRDYCQKCWP